jgi:hypothetical protein
MQHQEYEHNSDISEDECEENVECNINDIDTLHDVIRQMGAHINKQQNEINVMQAFINKETNYTQMYRIMCKLQDEKIDALNGEYKRLQASNEELNAGMKNLVKICQSLYEENEKLKQTINANKN